MRKFLIASVALAAVAVGGCRVQDASNQSGSSQEAAVAADWPGFVNGFIEATFKARPGFAVAQGRHEYDGQITDLSREAMGFNQQRGDTLNVANASFSAPEKADIPDTPLWKDPEAISIGKEAFKYLAIALIAWLLWSRLIRPTLDRMAEAQKPEATMTDDGMIVLGGGGEDPQAAFERKLATAKEITKQDPRLVASMVKEWMGGSEPR